MLLRAHEVDAGHTAVRARRGGMTSLVLKAFLIAGTVGLFVWADMLPDDADSEPVGWDLLLVALIGAALALCCCG
jgi:hypothetical protein